jgi:uncharacterized protein
MNSVFLDTAFIVALINPNDSLRVRALEVLDLIEGSEFLTTDAVLTEVLNFYAERGTYLRKKALQYVKSLMRQDDLNLIYHSKYLFNLALEHYEDREDKGYTDCMSMIVMENHAVQEVATSDKHFRQAGFTILM